MTTIKEMKQAIYYAKSKLRMKAKRKGGKWKGFGNKECRNIRSKFDVPGNKERILLFRKFKSWCEDYKYKGE